MKLNRSAFTLIELLVVIAIIGLLATLSVVALNNVRISARDVRRLSDVKQIRTALDLYNLDNNTYPSNNIIASGIIASGAVIYLQKVPTPPVPADNGCGSANDYAYTQTNGGTSYTLSFCIGKSLANGLIGGTTTIAHPLGMTSGNVLSCVPNCLALGHNCGDDGCGGSCGTCAQTCEAGVCKNYGGGGG
ncbi:MAG: type II secretion system protein [Patescibacteria group bacterium]